MAVTSHTVWASGSTGTGRQYVRNLFDKQRMLVEIEVESVGSTPSAIFVVEGLRPGGNPNQGTDWITLALLQADSTIAASVAPIVLASVGRTYRFIDGLATRFFDSISVRVTSNSNVTFNAKIHA